VVRYALAYPDEDLCARLPLQALEEIWGFPVVWVPPGPFLMGSDKDDDPQADDSELPQHEVTLPGYWIGHYPVTVAQCRDFVEKSGRDVDERSLKDPDDHPVRYVSWRDALAYCRWLSERTGLPVMLPSEAEWEKAARGTDGRIYPWGDGAPRAELCNFDDNVGSTTPVGKYSPAGDSPYGCADVAGNVREWTRNIWAFSTIAVPFRSSGGKGVISRGFLRPKNQEYYSLLGPPDFGYPYDFNDGRADLEASGSRVLRGGAFKDGARNVRCAYRYNGIDPDLRFNYYGFRVVVSPFRRA
jgi:formylglycine-generating enzyme required for sulfatase activity